MSRDKMTGFYHTGYYKEFIQLFLHTFSIQCSSISHALELWYISMWPSLGRGAQQPGVEHKKQNKLFKTRARFNQYRVAQIIPMKWGILKIYPKNVFKRPRYKESAVFKCSTLVLLQHFNLFPIIWSLQATSFLYAHVMYGPCMLEGEIEQSKQFYSSYLLFLAWDFT